MGCRPSKSNLVIGVQNAPWAIRRDGASPVAVTASGRKEVTFTKVATCGLKDGEFGDDLSDIEEINIARKKPKGDLLVRPLHPISSGNAQEAPQYSNSPRNGYRGHSSSYEDCLPGGVLDGSESSAEKKPPPRPPRVIDDNQIREGSILAETRKKFDPARYQQIQQIPAQNAWDRSPSTSVSPAPPTSASIGVVDRSMYDNIVDAEMLCISSHHMPVQPDCSFFNSNDAQLLKKLELPPGVVVSSRISVSDPPTEDLFGEDDEALMRAILDEFDVILDC
eukprot:GEMP01050754.1.p1 GENE.GEMP01050754.1~~GEMP01050754.1.p1  ORF type:complete len:294 (+),score=57.97 GEMP01050754.1:46-882(+)